jgi:hypothetical protein
MGGYSTNILRNFRKSIDIYWREYVGAKDLDDITDRGMEGYEEFRRDYAKSTKHKKINIDNNTKTALHSLLSKVK